MRIANSGLNGAALVLTVAAWPGLSSAAENVSIPQLQGPGHASPVQGQIVTTRGVVTVATGTGFYLQDPAGDGDLATSDAVFVTRRLPAGAGLGTAVEAEGRVVEALSRPTAPASELTITQVDDAIVRVLGPAEPIAPVVLGPAGRELPTEIIDDDGMHSFDAARDGIDFWESLEGMLVHVDDAQVVGATNRFRETWVVAAGGSGATGLNAEGGITIAPGDFNPERIQLQAFSGLTPESDLRLNVGDRLDHAAGTVGYGFGNYEVVLTERGPVTRAEPQEPRTSLAKDGEHLVIAGYNVENLDPKVESRDQVTGQGEIDDDVGSGRFAAIARHIVQNLGAPDIVGLQEVQDDDGAEMTDVVSAERTLGLLTEEIERAGGPRYAFVDRPPLDDAEGGQPGGNIRIAFIFDPARVSVVEDRVTRIDDPAFAGSRRPLAVPFRCGDTEVLVINVHLTSKGGSDPLFGRVQPPAGGGDLERVAQAMAIKRFLRGLPPDPDRRLVILGDFNAFQFELPLLILGDGGEPRLVNLTDTLPPPERRSYVFEGNAQALDHMLVDSASAPGAEYEVLHLNSGRAEQISDHDPPIARLRVPSS